MASGWGQSNPAKLGPDVETAASTTDHRRTHSKFQDAVKHGLEAAKKAAKRAGGRADALFEHSLTKLEDTLRQLRDLPREQVLLYPALPNAVAEKIKLYVDNGLDGTTTSFFLKLMEYALYGLSSCHYVADGAKLMHLLFIVVDGLMDPELTVQPESQALMEELAGKLYKWLTWAPDTAADELLAVLGLQVADLCGIKPRMLVPRLHRAFKTADTASVIFSAVANHVLEKKAISDVFLLVAALKLTQLHRGSPCTPPATPAEQLLVRLDAGVLERYTALLQAPEPGSGKLAAALKTMARPLRLSANLATACHTQQIADNVKKVEGAVVVLSGQVVQQGKVGQLVDGQAGLAEQQADIMKGQDVIQRQQGEIIQLLLTCVQPQPQSQQQGASQAPLQQQQQQQATGQAQQWASPRKLHSAPPSPQVQQAAELGQRRQPLRSYRVDLDSEQVSPNKEAAAVPFKVYTNKAYQESPW